MNCLEFVQLAVDLAEDRLTDAAVRKSALAHAMSCARCAALLADERVLASGLRVWADDTAHAAAPLPVKQSLLAAFDQLHARQPVRAAASPSSLEMLRLSLTSFFAPQPWVLAALLLLGAVVSLVIMLRQPVTQGPTIAGGDPTPAPTTQLAPSIPQPSVATNELTVNRLKSRAVRHTPRRRVLPAQIVPAGENQLVANNNEFIPLTYAADPQTLRNGLLVRVEVPRATLLAMGLPLNAERAAAKIKADVMMGEDGVAYAIRFVNN